MSLISKIGNYLLQQSVRKRNRTKKMFDLDGAKSVGILFTADTVESYDRIVKLVNKLVDEREMKVLSIGFVENKKHIDFFTEQPGFRFFSIKQCNWYGKPKDHSVDYFVEKEFDVLFYLNLKENTTMDYVAGLSKAHYKVGRTIENSRLLDMMIELKADNNLDFLIAQIEKYLTMFKVK